MEQLVLGSAVTSRLRLHIAQTQSIRFQINTPPHDLPQLFTHGCFSAHSLSQVCAPECASLLILWPPLLSCPLLSCFTSGSRSRQDRLSRESRSWGSVLPMLLVSGSLQLLRLQGWWPLPVHTTVTPTTQDNQPLCFSQLLTGGQKGAFFFSSPIQSGALFQAVELFFVAMTKNNCRA